jgi:RES domain-containing protein
LDGAGGLAVQGRWHSKGRPIVYLADSSALAMLEMLVHLEVETLPPPFQLLKVSAPDDLANDKWPKRRDPREPEATRAWGDAWLEAGATPLARVPSVVVPNGVNWLLNPGHPDAAKLRIEGSSRWPWDKRLFAG